MIEATDPLTRHENAQAAAQARPRLIVTCTWDQVPHLGEVEKKRLLTTYPDYQRDARSKGVPSLGAGSIYRVPESEFKIDPFPIPKHWPRGYGMDVGWKRTAGIFGALDRDTDTMYLYALHYRGHEEPSVHADGIKAVAGDWMPGRIDPAAAGRTQDDGDQLLRQYREKGLILQMADHAVEAGIFAVYERLSTGRLKVFSSLSPWFMEYRLYRRNEKGAIVKDNDHLMDATRYLILSGVSWLTVPPLTHRSRAASVAPTGGGMGGGWSMG